MRNEARAFHRWHPWQFSGGLMSQRSFNVWPISCWVSFSFFDQSSFASFGCPYFATNAAGIFVLRFPIEIVDLLFGPQEIFRMPMAFEAPGHAVRLGMIDDRHVIDLAVAARATDPAVHVRGVIVINVIGRAMELHPLDRLAGFPARPHRLQFRIVLLHLGMASHAGLGVGQIRMRGHVDKTVAITAIHSELRDVHVVRERHGLDRLDNRRACISG